MEKRYRKMLHELSGHINPELIGVWTRYINMVKEFLTPAEVSHARNLSDVCDKLFEKGIISYGKYGKLLAIFEIISHKQCQDIVRKYSSGNIDASRIDRMRKSSEQDIHALHPPLHAREDSTAWHMANQSMDTHPDMHPQLDLIKIKIKKEYIKTMTRKDIYNLTYNVKQEIMHRTAIGKQNFQRSIVRQERDDVCVFLQTTASSDSTEMVKRIVKTFIPNHDFIYDHDTKIRRISDETFSLNIKTKFAYDDRECSLTKQRQMHYKSDMEKLLDRNGEKAVAVDLAKIKKMSGKEYVAFTIVSNDYTTEELHRHLEHNCGGLMFEEITSQGYGQEHLHASWIYTDTVCKMKDTLEEKLMKSKDANEILDFWICCPECHVDTYSKKEQENDVMVANSSNDKFMEKGFLIYLWIQGYQFVEELKDHHSKEFAVLKECIRKQLMHILLEAHDWKGAYSIRNISFQKTTCSPSPVAIIHLQSNTFQNQEDIIEKIQELTGMSNDLLKVVTKEDVLKQLENEYAEEKNSTDDTPSDLAEGHRVNLLLQTLSYVKELQDESSLQYYNMNHFVRLRLDGSLLEVHGWKRDYCITKVKFLASKKGNAIRASFWITSEQYAKKSALEQKLDSFLGPDSIFSFEDRSDMKPRQHQSSLIGISVDDATKPMKQRDQTYKRTICYVILLLMLMVMMFFLGIAVAKIDYISGYIAGGHESTKTEL